MPDDGLQALEAQLGRRAPAGLARLDSEQLQDLAEAIRSAKRRQADELAAAGEQAFSHIPRLLRGPIRRVMG